MSIVKIQPVKRLDSAINYIKQETKTNDNLIYTFDCDEEVILEDFQELYDLRLEEINRETNNKAKMIIQSFDYQDNITPEIAHEIGKKLADNYLKGNHKYIIATHLDTNNIHNHIIFNEVRTDNLLMFDTSRKNTIDNLRVENDKLSKEYNLTIPEEKSHKNKIKYISQREERVRKKGKSFKEELENTIDEVIKVSNNYDEFIKEMEVLGFKSKQGKHLAFLNTKSNRFMRTKTLGMNYTENSIKYRIENKDFEIHKFKYIVNTKRVDTSQGKFKNNYGLKKWGTKQNILHLQEISNLVFNENKTLEEIENIQKTEEEFMRDVANDLNKKDETIKELSKKINCFKDYKESAGLIADYKKATNKKEFKKNNYPAFKRYDNAKKDIYLLKKHYEVTNEDDLTSLIDNVKDDRNELYKQITKLQKDKQTELQDKKEKESEKKKEKEKKLTPKKRRRLSR